MMSATDLNKALGLLEPPRILPGSTMPTLNRNGDLQALYINPTDGDCGFSTQKTCSNILSCAYTLNPGRMQ